MIKRFFITNTGGYFGMSAVKFPAEVFVPDENIFSDLLEVPSSELLRIGCDSSYFLDIAYCFNDTEYVTTETSE